jgi:hypothetical protein
MKNQKHKNKTNQDNVWQISNDRLLKRKEEENCIDICRSFMFKWIYYSN